MAQTLIGKTIAHYKVTARLGAGGMGEVYHAGDRQLASISVRFFGTN
jgi:hypothetical protein